MTTKQGINLTPEQEATEKLFAENEQLKKENEILKKALKYYGNRMGMGGTARRALENVAVLDI
tara:strand:+ start:119 stop:307 length:189 start_codon:yes stop_codon:yes gene_type:complete